MDHRSVRGYFEGDFAPHEVPHVTAKKAVGGGRGGGGSDSRLLRKSPSFAPWGLQECFPIQLLLVSLPRLSSPLNQAWSVLAALSGLKRISLATFWPNPTSLVGMRQTLLRMHFRSCARKGSRTTITEVFMHLLCGIDLLSKIHNERQIRRRRHQRTWQTVGFQVLYNHGS